MKRRVHRSKRFGSFMRKNKNPYFHHSKANRSHNSFSKSFSNNASHTNAGKNSKMSWASTTVEETVYGASQWGRNSEEMDSVCECSVNCTSLINHDEFSWTDVGSSSLVISENTKQESLSNTLQLPKKDYFNNNHIFESSGHVIPHPQKAQKGGEDAHFISPIAMGVADGVGGWAEVGIDPALYAQKLMESAKQAIEEKNFYEPLQILQDAYDTASIVTGSSTACIVVIQENSLKAVNLGDSGFLVVRNNEIYFKSKEQQHSFNFPFQLGTGSTDTPEHAELFELDVEENDIVILGSDGLFDNLFPEEILDVCNENTEADSKTLAELIAKAASEASVDSRLSPFAKGAKEVGWNYCGGKVDDISVVVGKVKKL